MEEKLTVKDSIRKLASYPRFSTVQKIHTKFFESSAEACKVIANEIKVLIESKAKEGKQCVLGLATGSTPVGVYKELIKLHKDGLSFKNVVTFNLDEYYPIQHENKNSYHFFMAKNLFDHIDVPKDNIHIPSGTTQRNEVDKFCSDYEAQIMKAGGIDIQILGIGRTGHIGFNQPPSSINSMTRLVHLDRITRMDNSGGFGGVDNVPKHAITMGISTILNAKKIILMAWSENKANIAQKTIEGQTTIEIPATLLHNHADTVFYLDRPASERLSRFLHPWTIRGDIADPEIHYDQFWLLKAIIWLSKKVKKPILRLTYDNYEDNGLSGLVTAVGDGHPEAVNLRAHKLIQRKITGWPLGGRPDKGSQTYFKKSSSLCKSRILIFSPHPDDDVICMGSTIQKLVMQGHNVFIAYQTSGSYAVFDHDAKKYIDFIRDLTIELELPGFPEVNNLYKEGFKDIQEKTISSTDTKLIRTIKKLIRRAEAKVSIEQLGVPRENVFSLDLPFYESGSSKKNPVGEQDYAIIEDLFNVVQPDYIYAAGDLTDPHGTHRICLEALLKVVDKLEFPGHKVFLYRGAWEQWDLQLTHAVVPQSPAEIIKKRQAIFKHQSQKDKPMFPGNDTREFWQRSEERNRGTAELLTTLGFTSYEGVECFVTLTRLREFYNI